MGIEYGQVNNYAKYGRPTLDFQFSGPKGSIRNRADGGVTGVEFTRTQDTPSSYVKSDGTIGYASTDVPRFDHDPVTGESLGLLIEESRTNLWTNSDDPTFVAVNGIVTPYAALAPDGTNTASVFVPNAASDSTDRFLVIPRSNTLSTLQVVTFHVKTTYSYLAFFSNGQGSQANVSVNVGINLSTNSVYQTTEANGVYSSTSITDMANGYKRISIAYQTDGGVGGKQPGIIVSDTQFVIVANSGRAVDQTANYTTDGTKSLTIWGVHLETGSFPTSYIPTPATFTSRASEATFYNENGIVSIASTNVARDDAYLPDENGNFISAGLLLEEERTNYKTNSTTLNPSFVFTNTISPAPSATIVAPDGVSQTVEKLVEDTSTGTHNGALQISGVYDNWATSFFVKAAGRTRFKFDPRENGSFTEFDLTSGTVNGVVDSSRFEQLPNGWFRVKNFTVSSFRAYSRWRLLDASGNESYTGDGVSGIYLWGFQWERPATFSSSYIPTTSGISTRAADISSSSTSTRGADVAQITGATFNSFYNLTEGSFFVHGGPDQINSSAAQHLFSASDGSNSDQTRIKVNAGISSVTFNIRDGAVAQADITINSVVAGNNDSKIATRYGANDFRIDAQGSSGIDASGTVSSSLTQLAIGSRTNDRYLNGHIRRLTYWPTKLSDSDLQSLTE